VDHSLINQTVAELLKKLSAFLFMQSISPVPNFWAP